METITGTITNSCTCVIYDDDGEPTEEPTSYCDGDCWAMSVEDFATATEDLRKANETGYWRVEDIPLWNCKVSGCFTADKVEDILRGMAVKGEWVINYTVLNDRIEYSLSHHDAPTGSTSLLRCVAESEIEEFGL